MVMRAIALRVPSKAIVDRRQPYYYSWHREGGAWVHHCGTRTLNVGLPGVLVVVPTTHCSSDLKACDHPANLNNETIPLLQTFDGVEV